MTPSGVSTSFHGEVQEGEYPLCDKGKISHLLGKRGGEMRAGGGAHMLSPPGRHEIGPSRLRSDRAEAGMAAPRWSGPRLRGRTGKRAIWAGLRLGRTRPEAPTVAFGDLWDVSEGPGGLGFSGDRGGTRFDLRVGESAHKCAVLGGVFGPGRTRPEAPTVAPGDPWGVSERPGGVCAGFPFRRRHGLASRAWTRSGPSEEVRGRDAPETLDLLTISSEGGAIRRVPFWDLLR